MLFLVKISVSPVLMFLKQFIVHLECIIVLIVITDMPGLLQKQLSCSYIFLTGRLSERRTKERHNSLQQQSILLNMKND